MPGLLDFANTDDGMQGLGLLAAAAPQMAPQNLAGRLAQAAQSYQGMKENMLKQNDLAQQIQMRNIGLQQAQQKWALQLPFMQALAQQLNPSQPTGNASPTESQATQSDQAPAQSMSTMSYASPIDMTSGQMPPLSQPTQQPQSQDQPRQNQPQTTQQPQNNGNIFGIPRNVAVPTIALGGFDEFGKIVGKYNEPTELMKTMAAAGIDSNSVLGRQMLQQSIAKANRIAPTRLGEAAYDDGVNGVQGLPTAPPKGFINVRGNDGTWSTQPVAGGLNAVVDAGKAESRGPATMATEKVFNDKTNKYEYQTKANIADAANGVPQGKVTEAGIRKFADINSINIAPPTLNDLAQVNAALSKPGNNALQTQLFTQERDRIVSALHNPQQTQTSQSPQVPQAASGAYSAEPSLGTTANSDAAQKASAQTMQDSYKKLQSSNATAQPALDAIAEMKLLSSKKNPMLQAGPMGTMTTMISPDAAKYEKLRANLIVNLAGANGTNGSDAGRDLTGEMVPDFGKPIAAQQMGLSMLENQIKTQQLKNNFLTSTYQTGDSKKYTSLESQFDQNIAPSLIQKLMPILSMPAGKSRGMLLKNLQNDPAMSKALNFAAQNGFLK